MNGLYRRTRNFILCLLFLCFRVFIKRRKVIFRASNNIGVTHPKMLSLVSITCAQTFAAWSFAMNLSAEMEVGVVADRMRVAGHLFRIPCLQCAFLALCRALAAHAHS